jgi:hypothetical protein
MSGVSTVILFIIAWKLLLDSLSYHNFDEQLSLNLMLNLKLQTARLHEDCSAFGC